MEATRTDQLGSISGNVIDKGSGQPIRQAPVHLSFTSSPERAEPDAKAEAAPYTPPPTEIREVVQETDGHGRFHFGSLVPGNYRVSCDAFVEEPVRADVPVAAGTDTPVTLMIPVNFRLTTRIYREDCGDAVECAHVTEGTNVFVLADHARARNKPCEILWDVEGGQTLPSPTNAPTEIGVSTMGRAGRLRFRATLRGLNSPEVDATADITVLPKAAQPVTGTLAVNLQRSASHRTHDQSLWVAIRNRTRAISFSGAGYKEFIDRVLCDEPPRDVPRRIERRLDELGEHAYGVGAYELLKIATEAFLLLNCGVAIKPPYDPIEENGRLGETVSLAEIRARLSAYLGSDRRLPYIDRVIAAAFPGEPITHRVHCEGILASRANCPCLLELIWSYWHEEGMLVQSINAVSRRFQNVRAPGDRDPLAHLEIDPLRPLNNILWGYIQEEWNRLTVRRRAYEYDHHYGLPIVGKAVASFRPADSRSKFLEAFHNLLHLCSVFFKEDNDTTVISDGYPLLNALKEVHLLLAQGAHNQFGDLPWAARAEMLIQQWMLARPEMRDFLQSRAMVPYKEAWMPQVDTMKTLQGWSDVTVTHFRDLAVYGEQILLSIRYGDWIDINDEDSAKNWARYWRPEIQGYLHGYRAVTGVDLTNPDTVDATSPSVHLQRRLAAQRTR